MQLRERLLEYGCEAVAEVVVEGFSRVKRCTNEGRALMSLDLQVLSLVNLVANAHNWKRKSRIELVERIENGDTTV